MSNTHNPRRIEYFGQQLTEPEGLVERMELISRISKIHRDLSAALAEMEQLSGDTMQELPAFKPFGFLTTGDCEYLHALYMHRQAVASAVVA